MMKQLVLVALCVLGVSGCVTSGVNLPGVGSIGSTTSKPSNNTASELYFMANRDLLAAETKWRQKQPEHYGYTLQRSCFCTAEYRKPIAIEVQHERVQTAYLLPEKTLLPWERITDAVTVEGLFEVIRKAIEDKAARIDVEYDATYGYPSSISIDPNTATADDEMYFTASELTALDKTITSKPKVKKTTKKKASKK